MAHIRVEKGNTVTDIECSLNDTLLNVLRSAGIYDGYDAPCGGRGICRRCVALLDGTQVLLCSTKPVDGALVTLDINPDYSLISPDDDINFDHTDFEGLGLAVDIGTTTLALALYDLSTGTCLCRYGEGNCQQSFGSDVISRVKYIMDNSGGLSELNRAVVSQISSIASKMCSSCSVSVHDIVRVCIAGNTIMEHIFRGLSPESIAKAPFTPKSLFGSYVNANDLGFDFSPKSEAYLSRCVSGYVGGDITAGLSYIEAYKKSGRFLFVDVGTNGEMAVGNSSLIKCCSTAAGPAFEGACLECGINASKGAIDKVWVKGDSIEFSTIENGEPSGICGSGYIDLLSSLLELGIVDETGRLMSGDGRYYLSKDIYITSEDIRKLQLAKAAIYAGIITLLDATGTDFDDIDVFYLSGGFGKYININSASNIGLFPFELKDKIVVLGNSSLAGITLALLNEDGVNSIEAVSGICDYIELSGLKSFNDNYIDAMYFDA